MYTLEIQKYLNMAIRRRWWIIITLLVVLLGGFTYLLITPRIYEAQTLILVQQQKVPEDIVQPIVTSTVSDRLRTIEQQVKSRTNLESIIDEYNLYESSGDNMRIDEKVETLRKMINVVITSRTEYSSYLSDETNAFTISFRNDDPKKAMDVTNKLAYNFISENTEMTEESALVISAFLSERLLSLEETLKKKEEEIKEYKERYMGGLPEQLQTNLTRLQMFQSSLEQYNSNLRDAENRRTAVLKDISELDEEAAADQSSQSIQGGGQVDELTSLKNELASLESRYTPNHPDVISLTKTIEAMERDRAGSQSDSTSDEVSPVTAASSVSQTLRQQLQEIEIDIAKYKADIEDTNAQIKWYERKVQDTPKREAELTSLTREYDNLKESYSTLYDKKLEADRAVIMQEEQKGEQFRIIDYAKIPTIPVEPNVIKIALMILLLGLGLGCGLAYLVEMMDTTYRTPDDVEEDTQLLVLANFPYIMSEIEAKNIKRKNILAYACVGTGFILSVAVILITVKGVAGSIDLVKGIF